MRMAALKKRGWTVFGGLLLVFAMILAGCGSNNNGDYKSDQSAANMDFSMADSGSAGDGGEAETAEAPADAAADDAVRGGGMDSLLSTEEDGFSRKVVYRGTVTLEAVNFAEALTQLQNAIHQSEGYILAFQDIQSPYENGATYTIKVPAAGFMSFIERVGKIKNTHFERQMSGTDVTEEYVDLESRLKAKQVVEERLLGFMEKATRADDLVSFSQQLGSVQEEIERIKGRIRYLNQNVAYSTIELRLYQPLEPSASAKAKNDPLFSRMSDALGGSTKAVLKGLQGLLVFFAGALPVLIVLAVVAIPAAWIVKRRSAASRTASPAATVEPTKHAALPQSPKPEESTGRSEVLGESEQSDDKS
jgi:hypothetical protein